MNKLRLITGVFHLSEIQSKHPKKEGDTTHFHEEKTRCLFLHGLRSPQLNLEK